MTPLFKSTSKSECDSYRLISVLSTVSKILENLLTVRFTNTLPLTTWYLNINPVFELCILQSLVLVDTTDRWYLKRRQVCVVGDASSNEGLLTGGVPQGSIVDPLPDF